MVASYKLGKGALLHGDALETLRRVPAGYFDSMVTDPPAGIGFLGHTWDSDKGGRDAWIAWLSPIMAEALRVMRPGGYSLVWAMPRTSHWTATALEDAGWEVCDVVHHLFGTGMPKSKASLKPAAEHWILARKPTKPVVSLCIEACRIAAPDGVPVMRYDSGEARDAGYTGHWQRTVHTGERDTTTGRWPSNVLLSHDVECTGAACTPLCPARAIGKPSRFFVYQTKMPARERKGNTHPTPKSTELMRWLCRLVTPEYGKVLDPFCGSGSTLLACEREGFRFVGIDESAEYLEIAKARLSQAAEKVN